MGLIQTGCLTQNVIVVVEPDGSGNIAITRTMSAMMLAGITMQMQQMEEQFGDVDEMDIDLPFDPSNPLYNREALERAARQYGVGVTFVNARPVDRAGAKGVQVMYAFEDINNVRINPNIMLAMMTIFGGDDDFDMMEGVPPMEEVQFAFAAEEDVNQLRVLLPSGMKDAPERRERIRSQAGTVAEGTAEEFDDLPPPMEMEMTMPGAEMFGMTGMESPEQAMRMMFAGTRMSLAVEVRGTVTETTAQYPSERRPTRFTVYDIDFDRAMGHDDFDLFTEDMDALESADSPDAFMNVLYALPTVTVENQSELRINFQ